jgi:hypothetical protein
VSLTLFDGEFFDVIIGRDILQFCNVVMNRSTETYTLSCLMLPASGLRNSRIHGVKPAAVARKHQCSIGVPADQSRRL